MRWRLRCNWRCCRSIMISIRSWYRRSRRWGRSMKGRRDLMSLIVRILSRNWRRRRCRRIQGGSRGRGRSRRLFRRLHRARVSIQNSRVKLESRRRHLHTTSPTTRQMLKLNVAMIRRFQMFSMRPWSTLSQRKTITVILRSKSQMFLRPRLRGGRPSSSSKRWLISKRLFSVIKMEMERLRTDKTMRTRRLRL